MDKFFHGQVFTEGSKENHGCYWFWAVYCSLFCGRGNVGEFKAIDWQRSNASVQPCCHLV